MSFQVETENLRHQAKIWAGAKGDADSERSTLAPTVGRGDKFGVMAGSAGVSGMYDAWTTAMDFALSDAAYSFDYLDAALTSTANRYDDSDQTSATGMSELDQKMEEGHYRHG